MKKDAVKVGGTYAMSVGGKVVTVRIVEEQWKSDKHTGWKGVNTATNRPVRIKSAQELRREVAADHSEQAAPPDDAPPAKKTATGRRRGSMKAGEGGVVLAPESVMVEIEPTGVEALRLASRSMPTAVPPVGGPCGTSPGDGDRPSTRPKCLCTPDVEERGGRTLLTLHIRIKRHDKRRQLVSPDGRDLLLHCTRDGKPVPQDHLVRALGQAFALHRDVVERGLSIDAAANAIGLSSARVHYLLHLTRLGPAVIRAVLTGHIGPATSLKDLHAAADHLDWSLQASGLLISTPPPR